MTSESPRESKRWPTQPALVVLWNLNLVALMAADFILPLPQLPEHKMLLTILAFFFGALYVITLGGLWYFWAQRKLLLQFNTETTATVAALNQKIVGYENMARVYAQREKEILARPNIVTMRPEDAKEMAKMVISCLKGEGKVTTTC